MSQEKIEAEVSKRICSENDLRKVLSAKGFETNYRKQENENGVDIVAVKDGFSFLIEHKKLELRDNGVYRYNGDVNGDVLALSTPSGSLFFVITEGTSLTKTARLVEMMGWQ